MLLVGLLLLLRIIYYGCFGLGHVSKELSKQDFFEPAIVSIKLICVDSKEVVEYYHSGLKRVGENNIRDGFLANEFLEVEIGGAKVASEELSAMKSEAKVSEDVLLIVGNLVFVD